MNTFQLRQPIETLLVACNLLAPHPQAIAAIESPGLAAYGRYYNMHSEDISAHCNIFNPSISQANCPAVAIGEGGLEAQEGIRGIAHLRQLTNFSRNLPL